MIQYLRQNESIKAKCVFSKIFIENNKSEMNSFTPKRDASCTNSAAEGDLIFKQIDQFTAKPECGPKVYIFISAL